MNRTPEAEARRRVNQAKTFYARLEEKNRQEEADYRAKIAGLELQWEVVHAEADRIEAKLDTALNK